MNTHASADVVIRIDTIEQLFNDPAIDPFSEKPPIILGKAALAHAIRQELGRGLRDWRGRRLIIQLPPDQVSPDLQPQVANAVRKYAEAKRAENIALMRISRQRSLVGLVMAMIIAAGLLAFLVIVTNTVLASSSDTLKGLLVGIVTIFIWSTVWNPWDRLVYEWIEPWLENRILNNITLVDIVVQPEPISADRMRPQS
jgi:hypothetical protein